MGLPGGKNNAQKKQTYRGRKPRVKETEEEEKGVQKPVCGRGMHAARRYWSGTGSSAAALQS